VAGVSVAVLSSDDATAVAQKVRAALIADSYGDDSSGRDITGTGAKVVIRHSYGDANAGSISFTDSGSTGVTASVSTTRAYASSVPVDDTRIDMVNEWLAAQSASDVESSALIETGLEVVSAKFDALTKLGAYLEPLAVSSESTTGTGTVPEVQSISYSSVSVGSVYSLQIGSTVLAVTAPAGATDAGDLATVFTSAAASASLTGVSFADDTGSLKLTWTATGNQPAVVLRTAPMEVSDFAALGVSVADAAAAQALTEKLGLVDAARQSGWTTKLIAAVGDVTLNVVDTAGDNTTPITVNLIDRFADTNLDLVSELYLVNKTVGAASWVDIWNADHDLWNRISVTSDGLVEVGTDGLQDGTYQLMGFDQQHNLVALGSADVSLSGSTSFVNDSVVDISSINEGAHTETSADYPVLGTSEAVTLVIDLDTTVVAAGDKLELLVDGEVAYSATLTGGNITDGALTLNDQRIGDFDNTLFTANQEALISAQVTTSAGKVFESEEWRYDYL
jgi:hypothetical protein